MLKKRSYVWFWVLLLAGCASASPAQDGAANKKGARDGEDLAENPLAWSAQEFERYVLRFNSLKRLYCDGGMRAALKNQATSRLLPAMRKALDAKPTATSSKPLSDGAPLADQRQKFIDALREELSQNLRLDADLPPVSDWDMRLHFGGDGDPSGHAALAALTVQVEVSDIQLSVQWERARGSAGTVVTASGAREGALGVGEPIIEGLRSYFARANDDFLFAKFDMGYQGHGGELCPAEGKVPDLRAQPELLARYVGAFSAMQASAKLCKGSQVEDLLATPWQSSSAFSQLSTLAAETVERNGTLPYEEQISQGSLERPVPKWEIARMRLAPLKAALGVESFHDVELSWVHEFQVFLFAKLYPYADAPDFAMTTSAYATPAEASPVLENAQWETYTALGREVETEIPGIGIWNMNLDCE